jgi:hypothetical protein
MQTFSISLTDEQAQEVRDAQGELLTSSDIFAQQHSGHWAEGILHGKSALGQIDLGWLIFDKSSDDYQDHDAIAAFKEGAELPNGYYRLDAAAATKIVAHGILLHGIGFVQGETDASQSDDVIQTVLLGKVTYC